MADASDVVYSPEQDGDESQPSPSSPQDTLDSTMEKEPIEPSSEAKEMLSPTLNESEGDADVQVKAASEEENEPDAEVLAKEAAIAGEDQSTTEGGDPPSPPTSNSNSPANGASLEEDLREEETEKEEPGTHELKEEAEEGTKTEEMKEEVNKDEETSEDLKEEVEKEEKGEAPQQEVEEGGKDEGRKENEWLDVLGSGQLLKKTVRAGSGTSTRPTPQCQVRMKVRGTLPSGACIDRNSSLSFLVGDGDVIQAIDIVASLMEKGEVCCVKTDPRFAYGAVGRSPDVPPNTSVMYELELLDVQEPLDLSTISLKDLLFQLNRKRGRGNDLFQRKEFELAVNSYSRAVQLMKTYREEQHVSELSGELRDLWIRCLNNLAAAQLKVEQFNEALESVEAVLKTEPENVKALYRCGKVYLIKGSLDLAVEFLSKAANLSTEKAIHTELQKAMRKRDHHRKQERAMYRRMMEGVSQQPKPTTKGLSTSSATSSSQASWGWGRLLLGAGIAAVVAAGMAWLAYRYRKVPV